MNTIEQTQPTNPLKHRRIWSWQAAYWTTVGVVGGVIATNPATNDWRVALPLAVGFGLTAAVAAKVAFAVRDAFGRA
jgi:hypothetical protein